MKRVFVVLAALSVCALMRAQSTATPHDSATSQGAKASPSADGKPATPSKPDAASTPALEDVKPPQPKPAASALVLKSTGPVSTEEVVRGVAKQLAKKDAGEANGQTAGPSSAKAQGGTDGAAKNAVQAQSAGQGPAEAGDAVMEFQPVSAGPGAASSAAVVEDGTQNKSALKRVHGDLYGVEGADSHAAGGSVGASSKSGKTSVYIQSDQARSKVGQPQ